MTTTERPAVNPMTVTAGIPVGVVSSVGQTDVEAFKDIQVLPFVNFADVDSVLILRQER